MNYTTLIEAGVRPEGQPSRCILTLNALVCVGLELTCERARG
jgi:hypothetical protein